MADPETETPERESTTDELERLRRTLEEEQHRLMRLRADFDNFRRRVAREKETAQQEGLRATILALLPGVDALERALETGSSDAVFYDGVASTHRLILDALRQLGAEPVTAVGQRFDPDVHEAVASVPADGVEPGRALREVRRGWRLGGELLRPAQVVVSAASDAASDEGDAA
jgi:molecular chaperone GrpE